MFIKCIVPTLYVCNIRVVYVSTINIVLKITRKKKKKKKTLLHLVVHTRVYIRTFKLLHFNRTGTIFNSYPIKLCKLEIKNSSIASLTK